MNRTLTEESLCLAACSEAKYRTRICKQMAKLFRASITLGSVGSSLPRLRNIRLSTPLGSRSTTTASRSWSPDAESHFWSTLVLGASDTALRLLRFAKGSSFWTRPAFRLTQESTKFCSFSARTLVRPRLRLSSILARSQQPSSRSNAPAKVFVSRLSEASGSILRPGLLSRPPACQLATAPWAITGYSTKNRRPLAF